MHTSRSDLTTSPIEADEGLRSCIANASPGIAEATLITTARREPIRKPVQASKPAETRRPVSYGTGAPETPLARARDIVCALLLIVLLMPLLVLLALAIAISDQGSPIFAHVRVGRDGRLFKCYKLRTMYCDAEQRLGAILANHPAMRREWDATYKLTCDPRVTALGGFLRKSSLDELPQLFNVLNGSMTLVGPRPVVLDELQRYGRHVSCYLGVKPGLTGLWQVTGRSEVSYRRRVATDRLYARRRSLALDFRILLATIPAVLGGKGAC